MQASNTKLHTRTDHLQNRGTIASPSSQTLRMIQNYLATTACYVQNDVKLRFTVQHNVKVLQEGFESVKRLNYHPKTVRDRNYIKLHTERTLPASQRGSWTGHHALSGDQIVKFYSLCFKIWLVDMVSRFIQEPKVWNVTACISRLGWWIIRHTLYHSLMTQSKQSSGMKCWQLKINYADKSGTTRNYCSILHEEFTKTRNYWILLHHLHWGELSSTAQCTIALN